MGENYERKITPIRSNISRLSRGTIRKCSCVHHCQERRQSATPRLVRPHWLIPPFTADIYEKVSSIDHAIFTWVVLLQVPFAGKKWGSGKNSMRRPASLGGRACDEAVELDRSSRVTSANAIDQRAETNSLRCRPSIKGVAR